MMDEMTIRFARINFELATDECTPVDIDAWMEVLDDAVNWADSPDYKLFFNQALSVIGVSIPVSPGEIELLEAGAALGTVKLEVVLSELKFENLWLSVQNQDTDVISAR
jgi:high-affinity nickel permease